MLGGGPSVRNMISSVINPRREPLGIEHTRLSVSDRTLCGELVAFEDHPMTTGAPEPGFEWCPDCEAAYARLHTPERRPAAG